MSSRIPYGSLPQIETMTYSKIYLLLPILDDTLLCSIFGSTIMRYLLRHPANAIDLVIDNVGLQVAPSCRGDSIPEVVGANNHRRLINEDPVRVAIGSTLTQTNWFGPCLEQQLVL